MGMHSCWNGRCLERSGWAVAADAKQSAAYLKELIGTWQAGKRHVQADKEAYQGKYLFLRLGMEANLAVIFCKVHYQSLKAKFVLLCQALIVLLLHGCPGDAYVLQANLNIILEKSFFDTAS